MSIESRFRRYHSANPHVLTDLEDLARTWFDAGKPSVGLQFLIEIIRWNNGITTTSEDEFKINNDFAAHYARMLVARNPTWENRIRMRALRSA
ncbi:hypothetical protein [Streptomyces sp. NBC_01751]|uniref:hypothetical protein n=1 Tax=Streptomyces sp. NBC_01751 TaxID=2975929 RepID=UPI002DD9C767|nr:hypothetical protein [Streptomyces sp. NBC_01751]WSD23352.1 hypothetical protein OHA26_07610 [Streptomyces sp. NBC_01751]